ncbi:MAG: hypothetical protein P4M11_07115 [Candidatus Pacebacteria bacterium]|nr:hypothetical protein [Candidatus Paceibacterota bacterium]
MCEECRQARVKGGGHAPKDCKEVGLALMHQHIQNAGGRQAKEQAKEIRECLKEFEAAFQQEMDRFRSSLVQTEEQRKMQRLCNEGKYAELYSYAKSLPAGGANNEAATEEHNKRLLKVFDIIYEGLQKARNKTVAGAGDTLAEKVANMEKKLRGQMETLRISEEVQKGLTRNLQNSEEERKKLAELMQDMEEELTKNLQKSEKKCKGLTDLLREKEEEWTKNQQKSEKKCKGLADLLQLREAELAKNLHKNEKECKRLADLLREREAELTKDLQKNEGERKMLYETLQKSEEERNKILQRNNEEQKKLTDLLSESEEKRKALKEILQKSDELQRSSLKECDDRIMGYMKAFKENKADMHDHQGLRNNEDIIKELNGHLNLVEDMFDSALTKFNVVFGTKAKEVRKLRRILHTKDEEVRKRIAEEENNKLLAQKKSECIHS